VATGLWARAGGSRQRVGRLELCPPSWMSPARGHGGLLTCASFEPGGRELDSGGILQREVQSRTLPRAPAIFTERSCAIMTNSVHEQLRELAARPGTDVLAALRELRLLPSADNQETRVLTAEDLASDRDRQSARAHLEPRLPSQVEGETGASLYAGLSDLNTLAFPSILRLARLPEQNPFLFLYFFGHAPSTPHTVYVDMQVVSTGGGVRITATNNPEELLVTPAGTGGARVSVPVLLTTDQLGNANLTMLLDDQTEFYWFGAELWLAGVLESE
jgi:hypothetical protein